MGLDDRVRRALAASAIEHFERRVAADLTDVIGSERLAGFYRQDGRLEASAKLCSMLARQNPSDSRLARLAHVLRGERGRQPSTTAAGPSPFVRIEGFLPEVDRDAMFDLACSMRADFKPQGVSRKADGARAGAYDSD